MLYQGDGAIYEQPSYICTHIGAKPERHAFTTSYGPYPVYAYNYSTIRAIEIVKVLEERQVVKIHETPELFDLVEAIRKWVS